MDEQKPEDPKPAPTISAEMFQVDADLPSGNRYPMDVVMDAIREIRPHMTMNRVLGQFEPPNDDLSVRLADAATLVKSLYFQGDVFMADLEILSTPKGEQLKTWLRHGGQIKVTPRAFGETEENEEGVYVVRKYTLITVDVYMVKDETEAPEDTGP